MTTTHALSVVDKVAALASTVAGWKTVRRTPMLQVQPEDLPALGVYLLREQWSPDGDANAGEPQFEHELSIGMSGAIALTDALGQLTTLDGMMASLCTTILSSTSFIAMIEGINSIDRRLTFTKESDTPLAEIQIEMRVGFRSNWPPLVVDDLEVIHVETGLKPGETQQEWDQRQQIKRDYDVSQT